MNDYATVKAGEIDTTSMIRQQSAHIIGEAWELEHALEEVVRDE